MKCIHLFPTFEELEYGLVPTASEMLQLQNVELKYIYPHYYQTLLKVPNNNQEEELESCDLEKKFPIQKVEGIELFMTKTETDGVDLRKSTDHEYSPEMLPPDVPHKEQLCENINMLLALNKSHRRLKQCVSYPEQNQKQKKKEEEANENHHNETQLETSGGESQNSMLTISEQDYNGARKKLTKLRSEKP